MFTRDDREYLNVPPAWIHVCYTGRQFLKALKKGAWHVVSRERNKKASLITDLVGFGLCLDWESLVVGVEGAHLLELGDLEGHCGEVNPCFHKYRPWGRPPSYREGAPNAEKASKPGPRKHRQ